MENTRVIIMAGGHTTGKTLFKRMLSKQLNDNILHTTSVERTNYLVESMFGYHSQCKDNVVRNLRAAIKQTLIFKDDIPLKDTIAHINNTLLDFITVTIREPDEILKVKSYCETKGHQVMVVYISCGIPDNICLNDTYVGNSADDDAADTLVLADYVIDNPYNGCPKKYDSTISEFEDNIKLFIKDSEEFFRLNPESDEVSSFEYGDEKAMCVETSILDSFIKSISHNDNELIISKDRPHYGILQYKEAILRDDCERSEYWTQLIPQIIIQRSDDKVFSYIKAGTENRLHGVRSILFGGHMDENDMTVSEALFRELKEELGYIPEFESIEYKGFIKDNTSACSRQHIGLIYILKLTQDNFDIELLDDEVSSDVQWVSLENISQHAYESWSAHAPKLIM